MQFEEFTTKHKIILSEDIVEVCHAGIELMQASKDPHHSSNHVLSMLDDLSLFLLNEKALDMKSIRFEILLPAICWHDVWKSGRSQTKNILLFVFEQIYDGIGSKNKFMAFNYKINNHLKSEISYCIKAHARFDLLQKLDIFKDHIFQIKTIEAKILKDIDRLNEWNIERLNHLKKSYLKTIGKNPKYIKLAEFWYKHVIVNYSDKVFFFDWSKSEFMRRKKIMITEIENLIINKNKYIS